jgi:6-pyruvoyltetrahydropterin/6-carboxytetrahydropterin synthase
MTATLQPVVYKYVSTKEYVDEFPCAYKQWKADTWCNKNHGYSFSIKFYFGANELDKRGWVVDYGGLKELKQILKDQFDHRTLIAADDPDLEKYQQLERDGILDLTVLPAMGCELIADMLYKFVNGVFIPDYWGKGEAERVWCWRVEVRETQSNMAWREGHRCWGEDLFEEV